MGILAGDSGSPGFWNFFSSDLKFSPHPEDMMIDGHPVMNIEHADDGAIFSGLNGLQAHLDTFARWTSRKGLTVNISKTKVMGFGRLSDPLPVFTLHGHALEWTHQHKYLGVHVTSCRADIFSDHFDHKAKVALKVTNVTFTLLNYLGDLPPREGLILYNSRVDPHLTHGAEVALGVSPASMALLEDVQVKFLRRLLHVQKRSMRTPLFTETGTLPIPFRRARFALQFLSRLVTMEDHRFPRWCLQENVDLWQRDRRCWLGDLVIVLRNIGFARADTGLDGLTSPEGVRRLLHDLPILANKLVTDEIMASTRLDLVRGRVERTRSGRVTADPLVFRSYLLLRIPAHRIALTRLLTSNHALGIERGRWLRINGTSVTVPRSFRICRCCRDDVEDECHVLFICADTTLQEMRDDFLADIWKCYPALRCRSSSPKELLHTLLTYSDLLARLGRYVYDVLKHVDNIPMYIHPGVTAQL
ncbi:hypothetical protein EV421DRAFT_1719604 [Armillaria borealis]|uniref:Reverse transcriptase domain-containing protein n=1 Tax=Armillaria borealis TaxID=47425 RepID=A0AA39IYQ7_9AGAR|nr:hypothetical protein EV421DRAFT_1719604 [Armillaria borealis]